MSVDIEVNEDGETLLLKAARIVTSCERLPNTYTTVEPLDETRRRAVLTRRVSSLDPKEPRRRRPVLGGLPLTGRSFQALCLVNSRVVYQNPIRQDPK